MKKKGFTLIELLAVIIILAVIALIATPIVLNVIDEAKEKAQLESAQGILETARLYYAESMLDNSIDLEGNLFDTLRGRYQGEGPDSGEVYINGGQIGIALQYGDTCYLKNYEDKTIEATDGECSIEAIEYTDAECFEYRPIIESYDIDYDACIAYTEEWFEETEVQEAYCKGEEIDEIGYSIADDVLPELDVFISEGVITNIQYSDSEIQITGFKCYADNEYGLEEKTDIVIPNSIEGLSVGSIGEFAFEQQDLTSVIIPNSVTTIGFGAFRANQLTSVVIPSSVTIISGDTFNNNQLTSVTIPNSVTFIDIGAFEKNQLTSITIPNSVTTIGEYAFANNLNLTSIIVNKANGSITGAPWGSNATVTWNGN